MPTLRAALTLYDGVSAPLRQMNRAIGATLDCFEGLSRATAAAADPAALVRAREEWDRLAAATARMAAGAEQARAAQVRWNRALSVGSMGASAFLSALKQLAVTAGGMAAVGKLLSLSDDLTHTRARLNLLVDDGGSVGELERTLMASAQRARAAYRDTAAAVASMGLNAPNAFDGATETVAFLEQVNKHFAVSGTNDQGRSAALLQLTQAMGAGTLHGEELNSILEHAPTIARAIEGYLGVAAGSIKQYAEQGKITAAVVKNALFAAADETNAKFETLPVTWEQVGTRLKNQALSLSDAFLTRLNEIADSDTLQAALRGVTATVAALSRIGGVALEGLVALIADLTVGVENIAAVGGEAVKEICGAVFAGGTVLYNLLAAAVNGTLQLLWSLAEPCIGVVEWILNVCQGGFDSFGGAVANLVGNIIGWFLSLGEVVTKIIDALFGTNVTDGLEELKGKVTAWGKTENSVTLNREAPAVMEHRDVAAAWDAGVAAGERFTAAVGGLFDTSTADGLGAFSLGETLDGIYEHTAHTAVNTAAAADSLSLGEEDVKYLRELAEREAINRFTTAEVKVDMSGMTNKIDSAADLDGIFAELGARFAEALTVSREGV